MRKRGQDPQEEQGIAGQRPRHPRRHRDEGRLIDVAPLEVPAAGEEVQLVAEDAVAAAGGEVQAEHAEGSEQDGPRRRVRAGLRPCACG